jgi:hypothetical protein
MTNLTNNKMMNANMSKLLAKKNNKAVVTSVNTLVGNRHDEVLSTVYNGTVDLKTLLNITDKCIDMTQCQFPIKTMQLIYSAGSEVGKVTIQGQNMYMIDVTTEDGFETFKDGLKPLKNKATHVPYESVWMEGYNMFKQFNFTTGQYYVYYVVTNEEMAMLKDRIAAMSKDKMTVEDAKLVQADLPPFVRAWQESSIDVSKDKDKVFNIRMDQVLGKTETLSQLTKKYKDSISFGFDAVKKAKHAGKIVPDFKYTNDAVEKDAPVVDLMGHVNIALQETTVEKLNGALKSLYAVSNNDLYAPFINDTQISKELAYYIKSIYNICYDSIDDEYGLTKERFEVLRNVIYTAALNYGVDREDVIKVAIATAMTKVYKDKEGNIITKDANINRFKQYPVANIFPDEFVSVLTDMPMYDTFIPEETISNITRDIEDNEEIIFVNGVSEDGCIELYDAEFNGALVEYEGNLIHFKDVYAFDVTNALLANENTFKEKATKEELMRVKSGDKSACDNGEYLNSVHESLTEAVIAGANVNLLTANKHFLCQFIANYSAVKGAVAIKDIITYEADNGSQQTFLMLV